jgi:hypothetical protein
MVTELASSTTSESRRLIMTTTLDPGDREWSDAEARGRGLPHSIRQFDLLDFFGRRLADATGVHRAQAPDGTPRLDFDLVKRAGVAVMRAPRAHWLLLSFAVALGVFSVTVAGLFVTGRLGDVYEVIYTWWPGRPWTHVMRDSPWLYGGLVVPLGAVPYALAPPQRWGRAFLTYVIFLIGFLGGHVFW